jgi:hypothetical protein
MNANKSAMAAVTSSLICSTAIAADSLIAIFLTRPKSHVPSPSLLVLGGSISAKKIGDVFLAMRLRRDAVG